MALPDASEYARLPYPFLRDGADEAAALEALDGAIAILVEGPALDAAIEAATARLDFEEQQRLVKRKLEFESRLRHMASARDKGNPGDTAAEAAGNKTAD